MGEPAKKQAILMANSNKKLTQNISESDPENEVTEFLSWLVSWLVGFYGIFVGYLTPNSVYMYIHSTKDF